jgi:hypothetical protein
MFQCCVRLKYRFNVVRQQSANQFGPCHIWAFFLILFLTYEEYADKIKTERQPIRDMWTGQYSRVKYLSLCFKVTGECVKVCGLTSPAFRVIPRTAS